MTEIQRATTAEVEQALLQLPGLWWAGTYRLTDNHHAIFRFENNVGASVIHGRYTYGLELAVLVWDDEAPGWTDDAGDRFLIYQEHSDFGGPLDDRAVHSDGIYGWLTPASLGELLDRLKALPAPGKELEA
ncbi:hypothetical protein PBI_DEWDROP_105 [Microbacterium phage Dewdrop]|nr:hypothetical protein PBI_LEAF_105 [Microbacterium phage Leaf]QGZ17473.1 hypothetical protein PBI_DEWDROP_105 [Microbacterium phage Dewdrop]